MTQVPRILVANRGEIAVRVINACRGRGFETVLAVSDVDRDSLGARLADRTVCIGPGPAASSYLSREAVLTAALGTGCTAIHPGYGFLAEDDVFAAMCADADVVFVGPSAEHLRLFGDKVVARAVAQRAGVPVSKGSPPLTDAQHAMAVAEELGYPVIVKAVAGGGGRGMRVAPSDAELVGAFPLAAAEAGAAFGDERLYLERWMAKARHVEVQIAGDSTGHAVHLGDRECSVQRRHQKLLEEAPAPGLPPGVSDAMRAAAVALAREVRYDSVGTVEFLVDEQTGQFVFLETNPRIQVEHGISELVTGVDIVQLQLDIAIGGRLGLRQADVTVDGAALECRINAEDPERDFRPSPGRITTWRPPVGQSVRVDTHCYAGYVVPPHYDSLVAKVMTAGSDRNAAIARMRSALASFSVEGIDTNLALSREIIEHPDFAAAGVTTRWLDDIIAAEPALVSGQHSTRLLASQEGGVDE